MKIYLASRSPRRRALLKKFGFRFQCLFPNIKERLKTKNPKQLAIKIAQQKVNAVKDKINQGIIIGIDTIIVINNRIIGKPKNKADARKILKSLSGKTHKVISGIYILQKPNQRSIKLTETTKVTFRKLADWEIEKYLKTNEPYDKAGAYGIQGRAGIFVKKINGCYFNVVGLPINKLLVGLKRLAKNNDLWFKKL